MRKLILLAIAISLLGSCQQQEKSKGDVLFAKGDFSKAIAEYTSYIKVNPKHIKSIYNRGRSYEEIKKYDKAEADFLTVIDIDSKNTNAMLSLAELKYRQKIYDKSRYYAELVLKEDENLSLGHFWLGRSLHQLGEFDKALKSYNNAIALNSNLGEAYLYRGAIYIVTKKKSLGCNDFQKALNLGAKNASGAIDTYCK